MASLDAGLRYRPDRVSPPLAAGLALLMAAGASGISADGESNSVIRVYVSAGDPASEFVDPATRDSAEDLRASLRQKRSLSVVDDPDAGDLLVRVDRRHKQPSGSQTAIATGPRTAIAIPVDEQVVYATLVVGDYTLELVGAHTRSWKAAAGKLAEQIEKWAEENRARLLARRPRR